MTKEDIKKALEMCISSAPCDNCPYHNDGRCSDTLKNDALNLITEQEKEIERLKEEKKQAQIDVLNELKPLLEGYIHKTTGESLYVYTCKMFNIEVQNAEDKG